MNITVKGWHAAAVLIVQIFVLAVAWGQIKQQVADLQSEVVELQHSSGISRDEFNSFRQEMLDRMSRIEQDILDKNVRSLR